MTVYALRLDSGVDTAARVRMADMLSLPAGASPLTAPSALRADGGGAVAVVAGTMNVTVNPFMAWVQGSVSTAQAGYPFVCDATVTLTLAAGDASRSRTDVIAAVVRDSAFDGSSNVDARVIVVQGTPGSGTPALPANSVALRNINIPAGLSAGSGGLQASNLSTDRRAYLGDTDWQAAPLLGPTDYGSGYAPVTYRKTRGRVWLRGVMGGLGGGLGGDATVFVLPVGFRPAFRETFAVPANGSFAQVDVTAAGAVIVHTPIAVNGNVAFSGITFLAGD